MTIFFLFGLIMLVTMPILLLMRGEEKSRLGNVRCRRCNYVGRTKGAFVPFHGMKSVCGNCGSDNWTAVAK